jgi:hypothetical protein
MLTQARHVLRAQYVASAALPPDGSCCSEFQDQSQAHMTLWHNSISCVTLNTTCGLPRPVNLGCDECPKVVTAEVGT